MLSFLDGIIGYWVHIPKCLVSKSTPHIAARVVLSSTVGINVCCCGPAQSRTSTPGSAPLPSRDPSCRRNLSRQGVIRRPSNAELALVSSDAVTDARRRHDRLFTRWLATIRLTMTSPVIASCLLVHLSLKQTFLRADDSSRHPRALHPSTWASSFSFLLRSPPYVFTCEIENLVYHMTEVDRTETGGPRMLRVSRVVSKVVVPDEQDLVCMVQSLILR